MSVKASCVVVDVLFRAKAGILVLLNFGCIALIIVEQLEVKVIGSFREVLEIAGLNYFTVFLE